METISCYQCSEHGFIIIVQRWRVKLDSSCWGPDRAAADNSANDRHASSICINLDIGMRIQNECNNVFKQTFPSVLLPVNDVNLSTNVFIIMLAFYDFQTNQQSSSPVSTQSDGVCGALVSSTNPASVVCSSLRDESS